MTCKKAQGFLERESVSVATVIDASKQKHDRAAALKLARDAQNVIVAKGQKLVTFDMKKDAPDDETLAAHVLGPTGNLRAPTLRVGSTLFIGFNEEGYRSLLKK